MERDQQIIVYCDEVPHHFLKKHVDVLERIIDALQQLEAEGIVNVYGGRANGMLDECLAASIVAIGFRGRSCRTAFGSTFVSA